MTFRSPRGRKVVITVMVLTSLALPEVLGACAVRGWLADSRDCEFRIWPLTTVPARVPTTAAGSARLSRQTV